MPLSTPAMAPRPLRTGAVLALLLVLAVAPPAAGTLVLAPPVPGAVLDGFDAPTRYGPGHRGVDLAAPVGTPVGASAPGTVTFAGRVVDATWVTVDHGPVRTTVGPLAEILVQRGDRVARGTVLGTSSRAHGSAAVHWSLRRGETYLDPMAARRVATLLPDGPAGRSSGRALGPSPQGTIGAAGSHVRSTAWSRRQVR